MLDLPLSLNYPGLVEDVEVGTSILIHDGLIAMEVTELRRDEIVCRVTDGGLLTNKKGVNVPDISLKKAAFPVFRRHCAGNHG